jgi:hypothetical protein
MKTAAGHLTYCTNIHAGETWEDHFAALKKNFPEIKQEVSPDAPMGIGLRLSNIACIELMKDSNLHEFKSWLDSNDAYVFTMNGFPYGGFHNTVVKEQVHAPDWTTHHRYDYTLQLFHILSELIPDGMQGGISTSPLSYRYWFGDKKEEAIEIATSNIVGIAEYLIALRQTTGKILHLDIEPEPDGILETGREFIDWYENVFLPEGIKRISEGFSVSQYDAEALLKDHITLCYDVCHFAIGYESHKEVIDELDEYGIKIGKFQISAALKADFPETGSKGEISKAFNKYNEPTYLHQVVARKGESDLIRYRDLPQALADIDHAGVKEWRAHFHVPVFAQYDGVIQSTQSDIVEILKLQKQLCLTDHLEVETYTWEVLPDALKLPINQSIVRELLWVADQIE